MAACARRLAGGVDLVQQFEKPWPASSGNASRTVRPTNRRCPNNAQVGVVDVVEHVLGPAHARRRSPASARTAWRSRSCSAAARRSASTRSVVSTTIAITPAGCAALVHHRRIVEVHPDLLGPAGAVQRQLLVLVGQRAAGEADLHDVVVEVGDLGPALAHLAAEQLRMAAAGEDRIGVVVDHDAVGAPQQHDRHRRRSRKPTMVFRLCPAPRSGRASRRPVERGDQPAISPPPVRNAALARGNGGEFRARPALPNACMDSKSLLENVQVPAKPIVAETEQVHADPKALCHPLLPSFHFSRRSASTLRTNSNMCDFLLRS